MNTTTGVLHAVGFNGYGQLNTHKNANRIINRFLELRTCRDGELIILPLWSRILIGQGNTLIISSGLVEGDKEIHFEGDIKSVAGNDEVCLVLLSNHELWKVNLTEDRTQSKLSFLSVESGLGEKEHDQEVPLFITATLRGFYAISNRNLVYSIPTRIGSLPKDQKVVKLVAGSGLEHCLALLDNGDVYVWGGGLKGQLGLGELVDVEEPTLLEALSGIRIIEIAAGGWHSCAISEFGDLYVWGWNKQGQLGIPVKHKKSIYLLPELLDVVSQEVPEPEEIELISCGTAHSIILTKSGKLMGTGSCAYGQLSETKSAVGFIDQFQAIAAPSSGIQKIICGPIASFTFSRVPRV